MTFPPVWISSHRLPSPLDRAALFAVPGSELLGQCRPKLSLVLFMRASQQALMSAEQLLLPVACGGVPGWCAEYRLRKSHLLVRAGEKVRLVSRLSSHMALMPAFSVWH